MSFFHLPCSCDKITQRRGGGGGLFERQMNSYTLAVSLRKSMTHRVFLDQRLRVGPFTYSPSADRPNDAVANCASFVAVIFKNAAELEEGRKKNRKERAQTNRFTRRVKTPFPVSYIYETAEAERREVGGVEEREGERQPHRRGC